MLFDEKYSPSFSHCWKPVPEYATVDRLIPKLLDLRTHEAEPWLGPLPFGEGVPKQQEGFPSRLDVSVLDEPEIVGPKMVVVLDGKGVAREKRCHVRIVLCGV